MRLVILNHYVLTSLSNSGLSFWWDTTSSSGNTRVSPVTVMKFTSLHQRGTT